MHRREFRALCNFIQHGSDLVDIQLFKSEELLARYVAIIMRLRPLLQPLLTGGAIVATNLTNNENFRQGRNRYSMWEKSTIAFGLTAVAVGIGGYGISKRN